MRILHITPSYWPATVYGGPTVSVARLCEHLQRIGHDVFVMTTTANGKEDYTFPNRTIRPVQGVTVQYFRRITGDHTHFSPVLLWELCRCSGKFDVVHIHSWWNLVAIPAVLICRLRGIRPFFSPRGMLNTYSMPGKVRRLFHKTMGKWLLQNTFLHTTGSLEHEGATKYITGWRGFDLPNIIDLGPAPVVRTVSEERKFFKILFLGRLHPIKHLELVLQSLSKVGGAWQMAIAGAGEAGYVESLKRLSVNLNLHNKLVWYGWVDSAEKIHLLENADLLVLTSFNENFSNAVLEALSFGIPVLVTKNVGMSGYVKEKNFGWVCNPDADEIAQTLNAILFGYPNLPYSREEIAKQVRKDFEPDKLAGQYAEAYRHFIYEAS